MVNSRLGNYLINSLKFAIDNINILNEKTLGKREAKCIKYSRLREFSDSGH
jgi:hypothetical protein